MGLLMDLLSGVVALAGLIVGGLLAAGVSSAVVVPYFGALVGIAGLAVAGYGFKHRDLAGALVVGFGLGVAIPITTLVFQATIMR
jgi:hypothetical protein